MDVSSLQPEKAHSPMLVIEFGISTDARREQPEFIEYTEYQFDTCNKVEK